MVRQGVDRIARVARWVAATPAAQLIIGGLVVMLLFPATTAGTLGRFIVCGALAVGLAWAWPSLPEVVRNPSPRLATWFALAIVLIAGLALFWPVLTETPSPEWQTGDWGPQHAVLAKLMPYMPGLDFPVWNHAVSTGDAPLELYPALTYIVTGHLAWLLGLENDLPHAFMIVAVITHMSLALTTTAVAARVAPRPIACVIGLFWLVDAGAISHGGTVGIFQWALLHSAFAHVWSMIAALAIMSALVRPRLGASVTIWIATAISTAAHPAALLTAATYALALAFVALLAGDIRPRRAIVALGHLAIGIALGACVWLPASERLLDYGQHFPNELFTAVHTLQIVMSYAMPMTAYSLFVYAGYLAMLVGPWTRRAEVIFVAVIGLAMMLGLCDATYLALGLAPGKAFARLGAIRMMMLARPFVFAGAAWVIGALVAHARMAWPAAPRRQRVAAAALLGVLGFTFARVAPEYWAAESDRAVSESTHYAPDREGAAKLETWASIEMQRMTSRTWARAVFVTDTHEHMHLTAKTGLPSFHLSPIPDLMLRERIEDMSDESLRRFNVRWVIQAGESPRYGDAASERTFGQYRVREIKSWDGQLARIEKGTGTVDTIAIGDDLVEIDVKSTGPVLVALGMGYYPRWRATHASGTALPVYALPSIHNGKLHVLAAWVPPGKTTFTCDGELPSDGRGRLLSILAALLAVAGVIVWRRPSWRYRALRGLARLRRRGSRYVGRAIDIGVPLLILVLFLAGLVSAHGAAAKAVLVGTSGIRPVATVEARVGEQPWQECDFSAMTGVYRCEGVVNVSDASVNLLNDAPPSWAFITPAIVATPEMPGVEVRISRRIKLGGTYWVGADKSSVTMTAGTELNHTFDTRSVLEFATATYDVVLTTKLPDAAATSITVVQQSTLIPDRTFLVAPPSTAPPAVSAIGR